MLMRGIPWENSKEFLMAALCSPACWPIAQPLCLLYWKLFPPSTPNYWQLLDWNDCISVTWRLLGSPWIPHSALKITSTLNQAFKWYQLTSSSIVDKFKFLLHPPCVDTAWPQTTYIPFDPINESSEIRCPEQRNCTTIPWQKITRFLHHFSEQFSNDCKD